MTASPRVSSARIALELPIDTERRCLINIERAERLMAERGVEALIAAQPVNVYYLSNFWTILQKMGFDHASLAMLPRGRPEERALIVSSAQIWQLANAARDYPSNIIAYTAPADWQDSTPDNWRGTAALPWPVRSADLLGPIEAAWSTASASIATRETASSAHGLARALRDAGLATARVASDDPRVVGLLRAAGLDQIEVLCDPNLFRHLRVVKSEPEINLMRIAARMNADACRAMARVIEQGMAHRDLEALFAVEVARRGGEFIFLAIGGTGGLPKGEIRRGEPCIVDAVAHYRQYRGDFGRTVIVGEPDAETRRRVEAMRVGWQASFEALRPGKRYSEIREAGLTAMRRAGYGSYLTAANPHSVGLQHTDEPFRDGVALAVKDDIVLEENMTLTVDFPHIEVGWGACHLEDLVRVTRDGAEPLDQMDAALLVT